MSEKKEFIVFKNMKMKTPLMAKKGACTYHNRLFKKMVSNYWLHFPEKVK